MKSIFDEIVLLPQTIVVRRYIEVTLSVGQSVMRWSFDDTRICIKCHTFLERTIFTFFAIGMKLHACFFFNV